MRIILLDSRFGQSEVVLYEMDPLHSESTLLLAKDSLAEVAGELVRMRDLRDVLHDDPVQPGDHFASHVRNGVA